VTAAETWRRNLVVLSAVQLLAVTAMGIVIPLIPFFVRELGVTDRAAVERWSGLIFSGPFLAAALLSPVWGWLGDRHGHKRMVVRAIVGLAVMNFVLVFVRTPLQFWIVRLVQGAVTGFIPAALAITAASTPPAKLPEAIGKLAASASAGRLVGPAVGGVLAALFTFRELFLLTASINAVAAVIVFAFLADPPRKAAAKSASAAGNLRWILSDRRLRIAMPGLLVAMAGVTMVMPIFPLYVEDLVGEADAKAVTGMGFAIVAGCTLIAAPFLGTVAAKVGLKVVLIAGLALTTVALALHTAVSSVGPMFAVRGLLGFGVAGVAPVLISMISRAAPEGARGGVTGYANSANILGFFVGPITGGWLANVVGVRGVFLAAAAVTFACAVVAAAVIRPTGGDRKILPVPGELPR
jgi:DHA1 family multidrug resistance protein-like MFS transporter